MGQGVKRAVVVCLAATTLGGCLSDAGGEGFVGMRSTLDNTAVGKPAHAEKINRDSQIIQGLMARRSVLPSGSSYDKVATAVLAGYARPAEAELKAARLRSEAASKNWLPKIGPNISLSSLGSLVANLVVDQVLFDHGRLKGEREFAVADVEVAAVNLATDTNARVAAGLGLYVDAVEAREKAALSQTALQDMGHFHWIMQERVKGGVSNITDLNVLTQKLDEIKADARANSERAFTAVAELNAISAQPLDEVRGAPRFEVSPTAAQPLAVSLAEAEKLRSIAAAKVQRAETLPGISASATLGENGGASLNAGGDGLLGLGTGASLKAIEAAKEAAGRRVAQANEDANRALRKLEAEIAAKGRQAQEAARLTLNAKENLDLFQEQFDAGQRQVLDVVNVYEVFSRQQEAEVTLKYETIRLRLQMAELLGVLADGDRI
ncbi:MAG: TolC family protein [Pseudomonadota bacterium]